MRLIIAGSRIFNNTESVKQTLTLLITKAGLTPTSVICGCAPGVDIIGAEWADERGIPVKFFPANWKKFGNAAGYKRNQQMSENADAALVLYYPGSAGSQHMVDIANERGLEVYDYKFPKSYAQKHFILENTQ